MPTYGKKLLDNNGNVILPKTRSNLVYHGNVLLSTKLNSIDTEITNIKNGTTIVGRSAVANAIRDGNNPDIRYNINAADPLNSDSNIILQDISNNKVRGIEYANTDKQGNVIHTTYLKLSGGNMTGTLTCNANAYAACHNMVAYNKGGWIAQTVNYFWGQYA